MPMVVAGSASSSGASSARSYSASSIADRGWPGAGQPRRAPAARSAPRVSSSKPGSALRRRAAPRARRTTAPAAAPARRRRAGRRADALARRADREPERQPLGGRALRFGRRARADREPTALAVEQERVLDDLPREEVLGEPGHEHDVERQPARGARGADEHRAVAPPRRRIGDVAQARREHELHLVELDRPDRRHRLELGERRQHRRGLAQRGAGERAEAVEPLAPGRPLRQRRQARRSAAARTRAGGRARAGRVDAPSRASSSLASTSRRRRSSSAARPSSRRAQRSLAADHRRVDQQLLPAPRRAQRARDHGRQRRDPGTTTCSSRRVGGPLGSGGGTRSCSGGDAGGVGRARSVGVRHLREREVLGEAARREALGRAGEQRQQRATGRDAGGSCRARRRRRDVGALRAPPRDAPRSRAARAGEMAMRSNGTPRAASSWMRARDLDALARLARPRHERDAVVERRSAAAPSPRRDARCRRASAPVARRVATLGLRRRARAASRAMRDLVAGGRGREHASAPARRAPR